MLGKLIKKIFGTKHDREMKRIKPIIEKVLSFEAGLAPLTEAELAAKTPYFKTQLENGATLDHLLPEAFAVTREMSRRTLGMRHYDVQILGGIILHEGKIGEMKTGEGKTLVATAPLYLNSLEGKGSHLVTVNDYLASRDADWMAQLYGALGVSTGKVLGNISNNERQHAYGCDITYGTNNEFGFDYLRDNMKFSLDEYVQRTHNYAIIDEVDSILIDEARTPLIISGQVEQDLSLYYEINKVIPFLKKDEDYIVDEKHHSATLTEEGIARIEKHLKIENLYEPEQITYLHHVNKALQAHTLYKRDVNYIVHGGKVIIVDEFTGRPMPGRRWSDGLHQAVEAKEGAEVQHESETLATITFQNYFRMYKKLAGMTGTADTEAEEFHKTYKLDTLVIPTHRPIARKDHADVIYRSETDKLGAIINQIEISNKKGQPLLVGTISVEKSEAIARVLRRKNIKHSVLNAKHHEGEASIVAQAGRKNSITIATNMAGRGTDIVLGGNPDELAGVEIEAKKASGELPDDEGILAKALSDLIEEYRVSCATEREEVLIAGGLFIIGTERHESRRIDNQLRGRSGRQGDPGESRFYLSLEDDLMRVFGADKIGGMMDRLGMEPGVPIEHPLVTKAIGNAQKRVEGRNFDTRKNLLEYDDVMNQQRSSIYTMRREILEGKGLRDMILDLCEATLLILTGEHCPVGLAIDDWDMEGFKAAIDDTFDLDFRPPSQIPNRDSFLIQAWKQIEPRYIQLEKQFAPVAEQFNERFEGVEGIETKTGGDILRTIEQRFYLREIDQQWRMHLNAMSGLRDSVSLRGYAQKDPKQEYKKAGYDLFTEMLTRIKTTVSRQIFKIVAEDPEEEAPLAPAIEMPKLDPLLQLKFNPDLGNLGRKAETPTLSPASAPAAASIDANVSPSFNKAALMVKTTSAPPKIKFGPRPTQPEPEPLSAGSNYEIEVEAPSIQSTD